MRLILILIVVGAVALAFTNPSEADFEAQIENHLLDRIDEADPASQDEVTALLLQTCQLGRRACAQLIRSLLDVRVENKWIYSQAELRLGRGDPATCYGAAGQVICPGL